MKEKINNIIRQLQDIVKELYPNKKNFEPTQEQLERWKQIPPTEKTLGLLAKRGFNEQERSEIKTQYECHIILNNLNKKKDKTKTMEKEV